MKLIYTIASFVALLMIIACKNETRFINYEKWKVAERPGRGFLKGNPKEVKEGYFEVNDTTLYGEAKKNSEEVYHFDEDGNLVSGYILIDTFAYSEFSYQYTNEGKSSTHKFYSSKAKDLLRNSSFTIAKRIAPGKYLLSHYRDSQRVYDEYHSFAMNTVNIERVFPKGEKLTEGYWYENNRLIKIVNEQNDDKTSHLFFYNKQGFLDSIVQRNKASSVSNERTANKEVFINNEYGDPTITYSIADGDTSDFERNSYVYDKKGNWVRRLNYAPENRSNPAMINRKFPLYSLSVREITY